ncbi:efflux RND transporter permease subunit, partial [Salmonella enterica subsp. enterica serovar Montevideo]|nr:efflux RND transporter permease subunit [Salmonella enterica subsp. enterica serovar Montevideo]
VDDAIVVVENVERVMMEDNLSPREATEKSMSQIQGALVGIAMCKVMPPMSRTEKEAIDAGTTWWEGDLFQGKPDWKKLHNYPQP